MLVSINIGLYFIFFYYIIITILHKAILTFILIGSITLSSSSQYMTYAQGPNAGAGQAYQGQGRQQHTGARKGEHNKKDDTHGNIDNMLSTLALSSLDEQETENLLYSYVEEKLAHDLYTYFYELYEIQTFQNIAASELQHMKAVQALLERYSIDLPTGYGTLNEEYDTLKKQGEESLQQALEVGITIEIMDINDIATTIQTTDNADIQQIFLKIGGASFNHLRGFIKALSSQNLSTIIDYSDYLNEDDLAKKGGSLQYKMEEYVRSLGVTLIPTTLHTPDISKDNKKKNIFSNIYNRIVTWFQ